MLACNDASLPVVSVHIKQDSIMWSAVCSSDPESHIVRAANLHLLMYAWKLVALGLEL